MKFVAVTSCPTGIAHTYMAAENLEQAGKAAGHEVQVETQGSAGTVPLSDDVIAAADGVIYAADLEVKGKARFAGKPFIDVGVKKAVHDGPGVIAAAVAAVENAPKAGTPEAAAAGRGRSRRRRRAAAEARKVGVGTRVRQWLMTGVSYMIPFVAAGGILIALGFLFGGDEVVTKLVRRHLRGRHLHGHRRQPARRLPEGRRASTRSSPRPVSPGSCSCLGKISFFMLVPILSGFIAFAIADRPGLVPGIVGGLLAGVLGAGFLGGLVSGFAAGGIAYYLTRLKVPKGVRGVMPVVVIPLVSVIVVGLFMIFVVGKPIAARHDCADRLAERPVRLHRHPARRHPRPDDGLRHGWPGQQGRLHLRRGRPDHRHRRASTGGRALQIMAAVMAAGMTPPLGMALATAVRKKLLTEAERENGLACWLLGASFITEGAIPFAAAHPLRVIPSCMVGSAVTGALVMALRQRAARPARRDLRRRRWSPSPFLYLLAIAIGTVITAALVIVLMSLDKAKTEEIAHDEDLAEGVAGLIGFHPARHGRGCDDVGRSPGCVSQLTLWLVRCARRPDRSTLRPTEQGVPYMPSRNVVVASRVGLHARPASLFVQAVTATGLPVTIAKSGGDPVDARSILMVMGLAVGNGEEVTLTAEGDGADAALDQLANCSRSTTTQPDRPCPSRWAHPQRDAAAGRPDRSGLALGISVNAVSRNVSTQELS